MQLWSVLTISSVLHRLLAASYKVCFMHTSCEQSYKGLLSAEPAHMMQLHGQLVHFGLIQYEVSGDWSSMLARRS